MESEGYHRLEEEFPEKAQDIDRCRGLASAYLLLIAAANPLLANHSKNYLHIRMEN